MNLFIAFLPMILFISLYLGSGVFYSVLGVEKAFYHVPALLTLFPAIALGWYLHKGSSSQKTHDFVEGARHPDIITMCVIFLLAGIFTSITKAIGSVESTVHFTLSLIPSSYIIVGIFIVSALISTSIGTSVGTIVTVGPIAYGFVQNGAAQAEIIMATVIGGAMFGDNLSLVSDTTIASVMSQEADPLKKFKINLKIALIAGFVTSSVLLFAHTKEIDLVASPYSFLLITPYILLLTLTCCKINIFVALMVSIFWSFGLGLCYSSIPFLELGKNVMNGIADMHEIVVLSIMIGGLSGLMKDGMQTFNDRMVSILRRTSSIKAVQFMIGGIVSVFDLMLANNTIAIILSGLSAREVSKICKLPPHYSAVWLDAFSCVFQGIIPYGAQVLIAASIAKISPLSLVPHVYYCYILGVVCISMIMFHKPHARND